MRGLREVPPPVLPGQAVGLDLDVADAVPATPSTLLGADDTTEEKVLQEALDASTTDDRCDEEWVRTLAARVIAAAREAGTAAPDDGHPASRFMRGVETALLGSDEEVRAALAARSPRPTDVRTNRSIPHPARAEPAPDGGMHQYLSTACLHLDHSYCQSVDGYDLNGDPFHKSPAQCKWCTAPCQCACHAAGVPAGRSVSGDEAAAEPGGSK